MALFGQVALEEAIHHAYPQTRFESPQLCPGELPYLFEVETIPSRHLYEDLAVRAFGQVFLKQTEDLLPRRALCLPRFRSIHALRLPLLAAIIGAALALKLATSWPPHAATLSSCSRLSRSARAQGFSTKNAPASIGNLTCTSASGYRTAAMPTARRILCAWTDTSKREALSRIRIETLTVADPFPSSTYYSHQAIT